MLLNAGFYFSFFQFSKQKHLINQDLISIRLDHFYILFSRAIHGI